MSLVALEWMTVYRGQTCKLHQRFLGIGAWIECPARYLWHLYSLGEGLQSAHKGWSIRPLYTIIPHGPFDVSYENLTEILPAFYDFIPLPPLYSLQHQSSPDIGSVHPLGHHRCWYLKKVSDIGFIFRHQTSLAQHLGLPEVARVVEPLWHHEVSHGRVSGL
jgi:hypothetical protein